MTNKEKFTTALKAMAFICPAFSAGIVNGITYTTLRKVLPKYAGFRKLCFTACTIGNSVFVASAMPHVMRYCEELADEIFPDDKDAEIHSI